MPNRLPASLVISLALITSACNATMKNPDLKKNPHPTKHYEVTVTIEGAPGPFESVTGDIGYTVTNEECVPIAPFSGAQLVPESKASLGLIRVSDNVYKGAFYADLMQDDNYFGMGVCHWGVAGGGAELKGKNVTFSADIFEAHIAAQRPVTRYYSYSSYHSSQPLGVDIGNANRSDFKDEMNSTFSVTVSAKADAK